jgi:hypothetical protein
MAHQNTITVQLPNGDYILILGKDKDAFDRGEKVRNLLGKTFKTKQEVKPLAEELSESASLSDRAAYVRKKTNAAMDETISSAYDKINPEKKNGKDFKKDKPEPFDYKSEGAWKEWKKTGPEGSGYDYKTAIDHGMGPNAKGRWFSRIPSTGRILKGKKHESFGLTEKSEKDLGYGVYKDPETGFYFSERIDAIE